MKPILCVMALVLYTTVAPAESWFNKKIQGKLLYDHYTEASVPRAALERTFEFLDINENKGIKVNINDTPTTLSISNKNYVVIIDYSKPSSSPRLYLLNLKTGKVEKYYVAHGVNSGENMAVSFSNKINSKKSSLGFYLTGSTYIGSHGNSLYLHGLEKSNNNAFERTIVIHGASYVSEDFVKKYGRLGRSWGCPALSISANKKLLPLIKEGAVLYAFHKDLMSVAQTSPSIQDVGNYQDETTEHSDKIIAEELYP